VYKIIAIMEAIQPSKNEGRPRKT